MSSMQQIRASLLRPGVGGASVRLSISVSTVYAVVPAVCLLWKDLALVSMHGSGLDVRGCVVPRSRQRGLAPTPAALTRGARHVHSNNIKRMHEMKTTSD